MGLRDTEPSVSGENQSGDVSRMVHAGRFARHGGAYVALGIAAALIAPAAHSGPNVVAKPNKTVARNYDNPSNSAAVPAPSPIVIHVEPTAKEIESEAERQAANRRILGLEPDAWVALFTLVLGASTIGLWLETRRLAKGAEDQHGTLKESVDVARKSALAAEKAADTAEKALVALEAPFVRPHDMQFAYNATAGYITVAFKNFGRSFANVSDVSVSVLVTPANQPHRVQSNKTKGFMFTELVAPNETSDSIRFDDDIFRQYGDTITKAVIDLHVIVSFVWTGLVGRRTNESMRFIWSDKRRKFLPGVQLWDDEDRFDTAKAKVR